MSIDSSVTSITGVGGLGGGAATAAAELAGTGQPLVIGFAVALAIVGVGALLMRRAHRNLAS